MAFKQATTPTVQAAGRSPLPSSDIWEVFRDIRDAAHALRLRPGHLQTLQALLSFTRGQFGMVFASNAEICRRAGGIDERTLRRHVKRLVEASIIFRQDSPNGKRYRVSDPSGQADATFGFNLSPMEENAARFAAAARAVEEEARLCRYLHKKLLSVLYRIEDTYGVLSEVAAIRRLIRRKLRSDDYRVALSAAEDLEGEMAHAEVTELSGNDGQSVRHLSKSEKKDMDSDTSGHQEMEVSDDLASNAGTVLRKVLQGCREAMSFSFEQPRSWDDIARLAATLAPMIGIDHALLSTAAARVGQARASLTILLILEMGTKIRNQRAYFTSLMLGRRAENFEPSAVLDRMLARAQG